MEYLSDYINKNDFCVEDFVISSLKAGKVLICIFTCCDDYLVPIPGLPQNQEYYAGWFTYQFDSENNCFLYMFEQVEQDYFGNVHLLDNSIEVARVAENVLKNMIHNAYTSVSEWKDTYNSLVSEYNDDFFVQWKIVSSEPDRVVLVDSIDSTSIVKLLTGWADNYSQYVVAPSLECERKHILLNDYGFEESIVDYIFENLPGMFDSRKPYLTDYLNILETQIGTNYIERIHYWFYHDKDRFKSVFDCNAAEQAFSLA